MFRPIVCALLALPCVAGAQFVWPKPEYNRPEPGLYKEDPFIVKYRKRFFAVFRGDFTTFQKAYDEIQAMVARNPNDARALVWLGNGQTVKAGQSAMAGDKQKAVELLRESRATLERAVSLRPNDPNIYMMQAATLYVQGQYFPSATIPRSNWENLRNDCLRFIKYIGPARMPRASIHLRGETYGELGIAYKNLGEDAKARWAFEQVAKLCAGTDYEKRARREIAALGPSGKEGRLP